VTGAPLPPSPEALEAAVAVAARFGVNGPAGEVGVILGSGLGGYADGLADAAAIPFGEIPHMARSTVPGHRGLLVRGRRVGRTLLCLVGRLHYYEGYDLDQVAFPVRLMAALGARAVVVTNASGGIDPRIRRGEFLLVADHINLIGASPLRGAATFADMSAVYDAAAGERVAAAAADRGIPLHRGVLAAVCGPQYETPAEVRMLRTLGADAVTMSSVPEAIVARALGLRVIGLSLVTNAAGGHGGALAHADVLAEARTGAARFATLVDAAVAAL
jgi:purine-nucleoside phosphorylase